VTALAEAIEVMRGFWTGQRGLRTQGGTYALSGVHAGPVPGRPIEIWVGALGPRMLELTGRAADGWLPSSSYVPPSELGDRNARIDEAADAAGRDPATVRRMYNVSGSITDSASTGFLEGPVDQWVEELTELVVTEGMDTFLFWPHADVDQQLSRWADTVVPSVRDEVARYRGTAVPGASAGRDR
jgi:alkanesulfonate monooxygenase SsuD/methylene tetrahydromethanopterin reductase-like flavin-dependent oxidoreductase (luciferase family)